MRSRASLARSVRLDEVHDAGEREYAQATSGADDGLEVAVEHRADPGHGREEPPEPLGGVPGQHEPGDREREQHEREEGEERLERERGRHGPEVVVSESTERLGDAPADVPVR